MRPTAVRRLRGYLVLSAVAAVVVGVAVLMAATYYGPAGDRYAYSDDDPRPSHGGGGSGPVAPAALHSAGGDDPPPGYLERSAGAMP